MHDANTLRYVPAAMCRSRSRESVSFVCTIGCTATLFISTRYTRTTMCFVLLRNVHHLTPRLYHSVFSWRSRSRQLRRQHLQLLLKSGTGKNNEIRPQYCVKDRAYDIPHASRTLAISATAEEAEGTNKHIEWHLSLRKNMFGNHRAMTR